MLTGTGTSTSRIQPTRADLRVENEAAVIERA